MQAILNTYYKNNARKLHGMVDKLLLKFGGIEDKDIDDFYSLANEVFCDVLNRYDREQPFETFLYSCLDRKIKTEMTRRNRKKRQSDRLSVSIDSTINGTDDLTIIETIASPYDVEQEVLDTYSDKVLKYLNKLSNNQQKVLNLIVAGYKPQEIREILHITEKEYADCNLAIHAYRNISILF